MNYKKEFFITGIGSIIFLGFALYVDVFDTFYAWSRSYEEYELDEIILLSFYYVIALTIISLRGWRESKTINLQLQGEILERKQTQQELHYQATHDQLTGLVNRQEFEARTIRLLSNLNSENNEHALCYLDLDQFKLVNDTCGHIAGDQLLCQLGTLLKDALRVRDTIARLGGDEFGILIERCSIEHACHIADSILKTIEGFQFTFESHNFKISASIGLVPLTNEALNFTELLKKADLACYVAKDMGRNCVHVYQEGDFQTEQRHGEMKWVSRLQHAFEKDQFCLYAQPIVSLENDTQCHYELLIRMKDDKGNVILPGAFIMPAERYNLMEKLDSWVVNTAFNLLASNPVFLSQTEYISINLSGQILANDKFLSFIVTKIQENNIQGSKLCFEITETAAIHNLNMAIKFISTLKKLGCRFALDDFGSGLSSFGYLKNLPVDYLKIDGMFVKDIVKDPIDFAMVKTINEIGQLMGMQTIAEFVENDEIKGMLKGIGVNYVQGYGISKPMSFNELLKTSKIARVSRSELNVV